MLNIKLVEDEGLNKKITKFINKNVLGILDVFIDGLDDLELNQMIRIPQNHLNIKEEIWKQRILELHNIIKSNTIREFLKPKYEYLLFEVLNWQKNLIDDGCATLDRDIPLESEIKNIVKDKEDAEALIESLSNINDYFEFLFWDWDFELDNLEVMVDMFLNSREKFFFAFSDVDLDEYRELMPSDLLELYDEECHALIKKKLSSNNKEILYKDIIGCCESIQKNISNRNKSENQLNDMMRDILRIKYDVNDQTRQGMSEVGKDAGSIDLLIRNSAGSLAVVEALKLDCLKKDNIKRHINKIFRYDTKGHSVNYLIVYYTKSKFNQFSNKYFELTKVHKYPFPYISSIFDDFQDHSEIRTIRTMIERQGVTNTLVHILVHMECLT